MPVKKTHNFSVVIPGAGLSKRMGRSKLFLKHPDGKTFVEHLTSTYMRFGCETVVLVVNHNDFLPAKDVLHPYLNVHIIVNKTPEEDRMLSLLMGMSALNSATHCFIHNIDNPFISQSLLHKMATCVEDNTYVVPTYNKKNGHPLLIGKGITEKLKRLEAKGGHLKELLLNFSCTYMEVSHREILLNINTEKDYWSYLSLP